MKTTEKLIRHTRYIGRKHAESLLKRLRYFFPYIQNYDIEGVDPIFDAMLENYLRRPSGDYEHFLQAALDRLDWILAQRSNDNDYIDAFGNPENYKDFAASTQDLRTRSSQYYRRHKKLLDEVFEANISLTHVQKPGSVEWPEMDLGKRAQISFR